MDSQNYASLDDEVLEQVFFWGIDVEEPEVL